MAGGVVTPQIIKDYTVSTQLWYCNHNYFRTKKNYSFSPVQPYYLTVEETEAQLDEFVRPRPLGKLAAEEGMKSTCPASQKSILALNCLTPLYNEMAYILFIFLFLVLSKYLLSGMQQRGKMRRAGAGGEACRWPTVHTAWGMPNPAQLGRWQGDSLRGCWATLSWESRPRPQRKGGPVGRVTA